jgi:hypothetical protein
MKKIWRFKPFPFLMSVILGAAFGCSQYKSFEEGELGVLVAQNRLWTTTLPYKSGEGIDIALANDGLLVSESNSGYHLARIKLHSNRNPYTHSYIRLDHGNYHERIGDDRLLVIGAEKDDRHIALLDYESLHLQYAKTVSLLKRGDFAVPSYKIIGEKIVFYNSDFKIGRYPLVNYTYPFIVWARYDIQIVDLETGRISVFANIEPSSLGTLEGITASSLLEAKVGKTENLDSHIYYIEKMFLVNQEQTLVFTLTNPKDYKLHYTMNLRGGEASIRQHTASELAFLYPTELTVTKSKRKVEEEKTRDKDLTLHCAITPTAYRVDEAAFFSEGLILLARRSKETAVQSDVVSVDLSMECNWRYEVKIPQYAGALISDYQNHVVYVPDYSDHKKLLLRGLRTKDGAIQPGLPANFKMQKRNEQSFLTVVGTTFDFENGRFYIHDLPNNAIVCSKLPSQKFSSLREQ